MQKFAYFSGQSKDYPLNSTVHNVSGVTSTKGSSTNTSTNINSQKLDTT